MGRSRKALATGYRAWQRGEVDRAIELLEPLAAASPSDRAVVFPFARALHEGGDSERALELLDALLADDGGGSDGAGDGRVHRALVRFDTGDDAGLETDLARMGPDNQMTAALEGLRRARDADPSDVRLPAFALWNAEVVGRLLALLEERHLSKADCSADEFHHDLYRPEGESGRGDPDTPLSRAMSFRAAGDWVDAVEGAFVGGEWEEVLRLVDLESVPDAWHGAPAIWYSAYSAYAHLPAAKATRRVERHIARHGPEYDLWFIAGLCRTRDGDRSRAGFAFTRATRQEDVQLHRVLMALAERLEVELHVV